MAGRHLTETQAVSDYAKATRVPASPIGVNPGVFERRFSLYNVKPSNIRRTRAALAKARSGAARCRIACLGESTTKGASYPTADWPTQLKNRLVAAGVPNSGTGVIPGNTADPQVSLGAGWVSFQHNIVNNSTTTNPWTLTSTVAGTVVKVYYLNASAASFSVDIDGAGPVTVNPTTAGNIATYSVTGLANTVHTVVIARISGTCYLKGATVQATTGLDFYNAGRATTKMDTLILLSNSATYYNDINFVSSTNFPADAVFIMYGLNDAAGATTYASYLATGQAIIDRLHLQAAVPDIFLIASTPGSALDLTNYRQAYYDLADTNDLPVIDMEDRWGTYTAANALGLMTDTLHPNASGYADVALAAMQAMGYAA